MAICAMAITPLLLVHARPRLEPPRLWEALVHSVSNISIHLHLIQPFSPKAQKISEQPKIILPSLAVSDLPVGKKVPCPKQTADAVVI